MSSGGRVEAVLETVRAEIDPDPAERAALEAAVDAVVERTRETIRDLEVEADVRHVGSTARGTWVSGDRDIDVFVRFDPETDRETLERVGLRIGNRVLPDGHEEYAEHPYVKGTHQGFEVDLVPCYAVETAADIASAVDRTPFHNQYLDDHVDAELAGEVRLLKQFLKGIGVYGSDLRTQGYSGYLTELLVLAYGGFEAVLEAARDWQPPVVLDPEAHGEAEFSDPLVVIDPTDPTRNVAAVVTRENVARFIHHARAFLDEPDRSYFFPAAVEPLSPEAVRAEIEARETTPIAVRFDPPDLVDDQLYPQLRRSIAGLVRGLETEGFGVLRSAAWADSTAVLFVEMGVATLPAVEVHEGPPVHVEAHASRFLETYADADIYGPYVEDDRYVVERDREVRSAVAFVEDSLLEVALGAHIESVLESDGYEVLAGEAVASLAAEFGEELARYFDPGV
jgi:tRNA nucleotidyltransferase (CCA-adding enzyme)